MYPKKGAASKGQKKTTGKRSILSDINMLENSCEIKPKPANSSSCDSSDCEDEPIVKRPRKTVRKVIDPSKILPNEYSPANVYTSVAKKSFEEIHSSKFDFSKYCLEEKVEAEEKEQRNKRLKKNASPEIDDDLIIVENDDSPQGSNEVTCVGSQSPEPPSPPPLVVVKPVRTRASRKIERKFDKIQSSLKNIDKALKSDDTNLDDSLIILDDDDDVQEESSDSPLHNFDRQIVVMVKIGSEIKRFPMNRTDTFCNLFSFLSKEKDVPETRLMLLLDEKTIHQSETPTSIQLQVADILDCFITEEDDQEGVFERTGPNVISLVIQSSINHKSKKTMKIGKSEMLQGIIDMYAKQNKLQAADLKLRFDGEIVDPSQTPEDLDMEDEDCLDLIKA